MRTPWLDIPLADYEGHMSLPGIGQAEMLAAQFGALLDEFSPRSVAVIGCAGGNGFDRVPPASAMRVVGLDINPDYVRVLSQRYADRIPNLELYVCDVEQPGLAFEPVDLIYAALVFEYVAVLPTLLNLRSVCRPGGVLAAVLQLPSETVAAVSPSPFTSLQALGPAMRQVAPAAVQVQALEADFVLFSARQRTLPASKSFAVQLFRRRS